MGHYHDHYLKKDVLLLADVFEKFIDTCLKLFLFSLIKLGYDVKVGLSPSQNYFFICLNDSSSKMMKNAFLFHLKSSFCSQDI